MRITCHRARKKYKTKATAIAELQAEVRDVFLQRQKERDEAVADLKKYRGYLSPREKHYKTYKNPTLVTVKIPMEEAADPLRAIESKYSDRSFGMGRVGELFSYLDLLTRANLCVAELVSERDAAAFEALRWKQYKEAEEKERMRRLNERR